MYCPKCEKFVSVSANRCPSCGISIVSGFSPNYGAGFEIDEDSGESRSDAPPRAAMDSDLYDDVPDDGSVLYDDSEQQDNDTKKTGIGGRLKSFFGFGK